MGTYVRDLLGDLVVATTERVDAGTGPDEPWLWLAIASGIAVRTQRREVAHDLVDALDDLVWTPQFGDALLARARRGGTWSERCLYRTALEVLRDMFPDRDIDTSDLELAMIAAGPADFRELAAPDDLPAHHWWWRAPAPPGELRLNQRMADLLALGATAVPRAFRRHVAAGFMLREGADNAIDVATCLPPDDSRRPVDLAGAALACARWLAAELRRAVPERCRIIATVRRERMSSTIHVHRWRGEPLAIDDKRDEGVLVLDTHNGQIKI